MRRFAAIFVVTALIFSTGVSPVTAGGGPPDVPFKLGNEVLMERYGDLVYGKKVGLITNQSGVNKEGVSTIEVFVNCPDIDLVALYGPEHGIDGTVTAGAGIDSYEHPIYKIPVYSLYGDTRSPTAKMLEGVDVLVYDIQDIGARTYTYISTLNYAMKAAKKYGKEIVVLDRPNPLGGEIVEAPVLEDEFKTFVGVDNLPMAHGMTVGELARFFNREIGVTLHVVPMEGYTRDMIYQDTGLDWIPTSPNIPDLQSVFGYMATGLGEGTGIFQSDKFKWIGGVGIDANHFAKLLNDAGLPGVIYVPEVRNSAGGVRLEITDYHEFNPAKSGLYSLAYAKMLNDFKVPKGAVMFTKIMGTDRVAKWLEQKWSPKDMENAYSEELANFRDMRKEYLIYGCSQKPGDIGVLVDNVHIFFDTPPYIDENNRTLVPLRAISEALGADVSWDQDLYAVTLEKEGTAVTLTIGENVAEVNGRKVAMDTSPILTNDRTMVPIRFVSEFLKAQVNWDEENRNVTVNREPWSARR